MISVIVPVYNVADYLPKCVDSILNQTYKDLEVILVDDGSTDTCPQICDDYAKKDKRIRVVHKENGGLSSARNAGLDVAKGDYISFIDSDDYVDKAMYEKMLTALLDNKSDVCICSYDRVDDNDEHFGEIVNENSVIENDDAYEMLVQDNVYFVIAWSKLYTKEIFNDLRFMTGKAHEDEMLVHHVFSKCNKIVTLKDILYHYYVRSSSIMGTIKYSIKSIDGLLAYIDRVKFFYSINKDEEASRTILLTINYYYDMRSNLDCKNKEVKNAFERVKAELTTIIMKNTISGLNRYDRTTLRFFIFSSGLCKLWLKLLNSFRR